MTKKKPAGKILARGVIVDNTDTKVGVRGAPWRGDFTLKDPFTGRRSYQTYHLTASEASRTWKLASSPNGLYDDEIEFVEYTTSTTYGPRTRFGVRKSTRYLDGADKKKPQTKTATTVRGKLYGIVTPTHVTCTASIQNEATQEISTHYDVEVALVDMAAISAPGAEVEVYGKNPPRLRVALADPKVRFLYQSVKIVEYTRSVSAVKIKLADGSTFAIDSLQFTDVMTALDQQLAIDIYYETDSSESTYRIRFSAS